MSDAPERFGSIEQFAEIEHAQQASAAKRCGVDRIRAGQRAGMGGGRLGSRRLAAGLDHDDRFDPGGSPRGRHELAGILDRLDIKQDRARRSIEREIVEQIAKIDVELVTDRCDRGKPNVPLRGPVDHACRDRAGLGNQREFAGHRHTGREARIQVLSRHQHTQTIGTDKPQSFGARCLFAGLGDGTRAMAEPGRDDDCGGRAHPGGLCHHVGHRGRRSRDDDQIGSLRQLRQIPDRLQSFDLTVLRVDEPQGARPPGAAQIVEDRAANRFFPRARADQRDRTGSEQAIEAIGRHDGDHVA